MRLKEVGVFKILGEMAKWANNSEDKQIQSITDEPVIGLDVFLSPSVLQEEGKNEPSLFSLLSLSFLRLVTGHCHVIRL